MDVGIILAILQSMNSTGERDNLINEEIDRIGRLVVELKEKQEPIELYLFIPVPVNTRSKELQQYTTRLHPNLKKIPLNSKYIHIEWIPNGENIFTESLELYDELFSSILHKWEWPDFYVPMDTGEPILRSTLFMEALITWGNHVKPVEIMRSSITYLTLNPILPKRRRISLMSKWLKNHDYHAIDRLLDVKYLPGQSEEKEALMPLRAIVKSLLSRLHFDFYEAKQQWQVAKSLFIGQDLFFWEEVDSHLRTLLNSSNHQKRDLTRIVELYNHLLVFLESQEIPGFLTRFYRFREAVLLFIAKYAQTNETKAPILYKSNIFKMIRELEERYIDWDIDGYYGAYFYNKSKNVADTLLLRNRSYVGHGRAGVTLDSIWKEYSGYVDFNSDEGVHRFLHDTTLMLRDLGIDAKNQFRHIQSFLKSRIQTFR